MSFLTCCVPGCTSKYADGIPMHCFPNPEKDIERFRTWVMNVGGEIIGLDNNYIFKNRRVCRKHFVQQWHYTKNRLCPIAIPTLHLRGCAQDLNVQLSDEQPTTSASAQPTTSASASIPVSCHTKTQTTCLIPTHTYGCAQNLNVPLSEEQPTTSASVSIPESWQTKTRATCLMSTNSYETKMTKDEAKMSQTIKKLRKKIQNNKVLQKSFKKRLMLAKKAAKDLNCLTYKLSKTAAAFVQMQISQAGKNKKGRRFTQEQKILSLSLYKGNPRQYKVLSNICILPHHSTLKKLLKKVDIKTGINNFMIEHLKKRVTKQPDNHKYCVVLFDEMAIATHLDIINKKIVGFLDNGETRKPQLADHVLVFMVRGVIKKFKQPVQYTFCSGTTSTIDLKKMIKNVIENVQSCGLKVVATVCDQGATNMAAINSLLKDTREMCLRKGEEFKGGYFNIDEQKIFPLYDPPHLMKEIRNNMLNKNLKYTLKNKQCVAKWGHIVDLYKKSPGYRGVRLVPKLTQHHVLPHLIPKMKVKCCTQVFSRTVGVALGFMADAGKLPEEAKETADIILFFDNLFDSVNASFNQPKEGKMYKCAVTPTSPHHKLWRESLEILKTMQYVDKSGKTSVVPTLSSWIKTIEGFKMFCAHMYKLGEKSLLLRNINQDPLENFFGAVRAHGQSNTMPTAANFQAAYKTLLLNNLSAAHSVGANSEKDSNFCLQNLQYLFEIEDSVEPEVRQNVSLLDEHLNLSPNIEDLLKSNAPHDIEKCAAARYCSGWLVRNAKQKIYKNCPTCTSQLESVERQNFHEIIKISEYSNKTWLCYPSRSVFDAFVHMEYIVMEVMKSMSHYELIVEYLKLVNSVAVNFSFVSCTDHKSEIVNYFIEKNVNFCIFNWCKEVNRILCGKTANSDESDPIKVAAQNYYTKNKTKRSK